jgi:ADP-ribosyl-[dinitrogen reductase] hydrolase
MPIPALSSRISGSLFGLAICDALGGPVEFKTRGSFPLITDLEPNLNFSLPAGCFTDDTSQALCLALSLIERQGSDPQDQVRKYIAWYRQGYMSSMPELGCFDIGIGTQSVLKAWSAHFKEHGYGKVGSEVAREVTKEGQKMIDDLFRRESYCGNGSLMRVIPVALAFHAAGMEKAAASARESSRVTHPHSRCQEACAIHTQLAVKALQGGDKNALAEVIATASIQDNQLRDRLGAYKSLDSWMQQPESKIRSTGYVIDTLEAALWGFFTTGTFEEGAVRVVNLGHDADTVGAVYGGLAGAFYGFDAIPARWIKTMRNKDLLQRVSEGLEGLEGNAGKGA